MATAPHWVGQLFLPKDAMRWYHPPYRGCYLGQTLLSKTLVLGVSLVGLATVLTGCFPSNLPESATPTDAVASLTPEEIENYAKAVWDIEQYRERVYEDITQIANGAAVPSLDCSQPRTLMNFSGQARELVINYCNQTKRVSESYGLEVSQFNEITESAQSNSDLLTQIQNELIRLRR